MSSDKLRREAFSRRAVILGAGKVGFLSALVGRLFYLQIIDSSKYKSMSEENRVANRYLLPERGVIVDRVGRPLAQSKENYRLLFMPEQITYFQETFEKLSKTIDLSHLAPDALIQQLKNNPLIPVTLYEDLPWEHIVKIETYCTDLAGLVIEKYKKRCYVDGPVLSSVLGYIGPMNVEEKKQNDGFCVPEARLGKCGIEKQYEALLKGEFGQRAVEVNARGKVVRELNRNEPKQGQLLHLTLDYELQEFAYQRLGNMPAATVTLDVRSGDVLSMISSPGFDPHLFLNGIKNEQWKGLNNDPFTPLINRVTQGYYAPGSIFKLVVALAGLEKGAIQAEDRVYCNGCHTTGNLNLHCWIGKRGHGSLNLVDAIARSCDVYFYVMAERMGIDAIGAMARKLGLGVPTGLDIPGERGGLVPSPSWKKKRFDQPWHKAETMMVGIGQSYLLVTPLQLAVMMARIASGGKKIVPRLYADPNQLQNPKDFFNDTDLGISPESIALVMDALNRVTNVPGGTGYNSRIMEPGFEMAGKSSSTQVKKITEEERRQGLHKNENREWKDRDHAFFCGFAPIHDPAFATIAVMEHGGGGGKVAAPIVRDILLKAQKTILSSKEST